MDVQLLARAGVRLLDRHLAYRCPECLDAAPDQLTPANDLWAVGCILYFLATGNLPIDSEKADELRKAHAAKPQTAIAAGPPPLTEAPQ